MELTTQRLKIRPIHTADKEAVFAYRSDSVTNQFQGWISTSMEEVEAFIAKNPNQFNQAGTWFQLVLLLKDTGRLIGDVGIHFIGPDNLQAEVGCTLHKEFHGKGYAKEALSGIVDHLFRELNKHRITTSIDPGNMPSIRLVERLGFRKEAHFKESLYLNGKWVDDLIYAMLSREWEKKLASSA